MSTDVNVASLIILTVEDLENLELSVGRFSLAELLCDYHQECPDRLAFLRHFLVGSKYLDLIRPSDHLMSRSNEQMEAVSQSAKPCFPVDREPISPHYALGVGGSSLSD